MASWEVERVDQDSSSRKRRAWRGRTPEGGSQAVLTAEDTMLRQREGDVAIVVFRRHLHQDQIQGA